MDPCGPGWNRTWTQMDPLGSAGFRRVPPGSAGFRRVPPGSPEFPRVPPSSPGLHRAPRSSAEIPRGPQGSAGIRGNPAKPESIVTHCTTLGCFEISKIETYGSIPLKLWENTPYGVRNKSTISFLGAIQAFWHQEAVKLAMKLDIWYIQGGAE